MNIKEISSKKLFKEYNIQIPYEEIDKSVNNKIDELIPTVSLPGFRKGKAPLNIVKKKYEDSVLSEVLEKIVSMDQTKREKHLKLEQLRALENNIEIHVNLSKFSPIGIDTKEDYYRVKNLLERKN